MRFCILAYLLLTGAGAFAQMTTGLTGKRDTSFSTYSDYQKNRKKYPDIKIVPDSLPRNVLQKRNIPYCNTGTRELMLDISYPGNYLQRRNPAILIIHGGGWRSGNRAQHLPLAEHLAALGYICFTAEYRLSTEALYPAPIYDLKAAVRWIRAHARQYHIAPDKITALGFSAGGELAAFLGSTNQNPKFEGAGGDLHYSSNVNNLVDIDGILSFIHPESGEGDDSKSTSAATYWFGYGKKDKPELWQEASSLNYAGKTTPPFCFINSAVDRMHAGRTDFIKILDDNHTYSEVHSFPNSPHTFCLYEPWFTPTVKIIDEFLKNVYKL
jgi:acetyl esterase/lipase